MSNQLFSEDVIRRVQGNKLRLGLVLENYDNTSDEGESDTDSDSSSDGDVPKSKKGHLLVAWYPKGRTEVIPHQEVELYDRSLLAGDVVQRSNCDSSSGQLGTVRMVHVTCNLQVQSTKQVIYNVSSAKIQQITPFYIGTTVLLDSWIGEVQDTSTEIIVILKNGARCALTENAASKLTDIHDFAAEESVFGEDDGFYPGQTLRGRASVFKSARWLSGQQPILSSKAHMRVTVEEVNLTSLQVRWQTRGLSSSTAGHEEDSLPPSTRISGSQLKRAKPLKYFLADKVQVGDKGMYRIHESDIISPNAVPRGSQLCYKKPTSLKSHGNKNGKITVVKEGEVDNSDILHGTGETASNVVKTPGSSESSISGKQEVTDVKPKDVSASNTESLCKEKDKDVSTHDRQKSVKCHKSKADRLQGKLDQIVGEKEDLVEKAHKVKSDLSRDVELLFDLHKDLCEASDSIVELTKSFQPLVSKSSGKSADEVKQRIKGLEESHAKLQEQICLTQDLLRDSEKSLDDLEVVNLRAETILDDAKRAQMKALQKSGKELHDGKLGASCEESSNDELDDSGSDGSSQSSTEQQGKARKSATSHRKKKKGRGTGRKRMTGASLKPGDIVCVEITHTHTLVDVEWQDGTMGVNIEASSLTPVDLLEDMHFFPGDFVSRCDEEQENVYGVVRSLDYNERTCLVLWIRRPTQQKNIPEEICREEISVYDLVPHPDFQINIGETVVRIAYSTSSSSEEDTKTKDEKPVAGQVRWVTEDGKIHVAWVDGSESSVYPQDLYLMEGDSSISSGSDAEEDGWIDEELPVNQSEGDASSSSWETASDLSEEEKNKSDHPETRNALKEEGRDEEDTTEGGAGAEEENGKSEGNHCKGEEDLKSDAEEKGDGNSSHERMNGLHKTDSGAAAEVKKQSVLEEVSQLLDDTISTIEKGDGTVSVTGMASDGIPSSDGKCEPPLNSKAASVVIHEQGGSDDESKMSPAVTIESQEPSSGVTASGIQAYFTVMETAPSSHHFISVSVQPSDQKKFASALKKEVQLLQTSLPPGINVKMFEDKMHLFSALIEGPVSTPYEDCLFYFDGYLPDSYPRKPPVVHYHAYCPGKLNPNLYNEGKICLSLLDTWTGKGSEVWTGKSNLLQLLVSIQGLILNSEPYFNEAGYDRHRGSAHGAENSRMYNETAIIKVVQSLTNLITNPPEIFKEETLQFCKVHIPRLTSRLKGWLHQSTEHSAENINPDFPLFPLSRGFVLSARHVTVNLVSKWKDICSTDTQR